MLSAVKDGDVCSPGCAFTIQGAVAESRGDRDTARYRCMTWSPKKPDLIDYDGLTTPFSSDASDGGNGSATITPYRTLTHQPGRLPRAQRRQCANRGHCLRDS